MRISERYLTRIFFEALEYSFWGRRNLDTLQHLNPLSKKTLLTAHTYNFLVPKNFRVLYIDIHHTLRCMFSHASFSVPALPSHRWQIPPQRKAECRQRSILFIFILAYDQKLDTRITFGNSRNNTHSRSTETIWNRNSKYDIAAAEYSNNKLLEKEDDETPLEPSPFFFQGGNKKYCWLWIRLEFSINH